MTKYINALARSICDVTRTILVWIVGIIVTLTAGATYPNYRWEIVDGLAIGVELLGFGVLVLGNLIYNGIVRLPGERKREVEGGKSLISEGSQEI